MREDYVPISYNAAVKFKDKPHIYMTVWITLLLMAEYTDDTYAQGRLVTSMHDIRRKTRAIRRQLASALV